MFGPDMPQPLLRADGLSKRFGATHALRDVTVEIVPGEVHVLAGENGAGKTTLVNILSGLYRPDAGQILLEGQRVEIHGPADAVALGIGLVHQHSELVAPFTGLENIVLGMEGGAFWLDVQRHQAGVEALARRYGLTVPLRAPVRDLSVGERQKVELLKTLYRGVRLLILDEPTALLTPQEAEALLGTVQSLTRTGLTAVFITHKIREVRAVGDRVTVLRAGRVVGTVSASDTPDGVLVEMMFGERVERAESAHVMPAAVPGGHGTPVEGKLPLAESALAVRGLTVPTDQEIVALRECTFEIRTGEVVGLAGVAGNGQRELAEALIGARAVSAGRIVLFGRDLTRLPIVDRLAAGLAYVPGDRLNEGILPSLSVADTLILGLEPGVFRGRKAYVPGQIRELAAQVIVEYRIVARDGAVPTATLSGGNIQKLLIARAMIQAAATDRSVLVAVNPTRGLDLVTTSFVHARLLDLRQRGCGVLLISEDLDELTSLCDRLLVIHRGRIVGEVPRREYDVYRIGALMTGAEPGPSPPAELLS